MRVSHMLVLAVLGCLLVAELPALEVHNLRSGNGAIGGTDSEITMLTGPADTYFPAAFTPADFALAVAGPAAFIIGNHGAWIPSLPADPAARWISTSPGGAGEGGTFLVAQAFTVATTNIGDSSLQLAYATDNVLGGGPTQGVYLNGQALSGSTVGGTFGSQFTLSRNDIAPLLQPGLNHLYICSSDLGGPGGLIYSATITIDESPVVEAQDAPGSFRLLPAAPNPFNPVTTLSFELQATTEVRLSVFDLGGRELALLQDGLLAGGEHRFVFDASALPSGVYLARLETEQRVETQKLLLVK